MEVLEGLGGVDAILGLVLYCIRLPGLMQFLHNFGGLLISTEVQALMAR